MWRKSRYPFHVSSQRQDSSHDFSSFTNCDPYRLARQLDQACDRVIVDHYEIGDGSRHGFRTKRTEFPRLLEQAGYPEWCKLDKLWEIRDIFSSVLGRERVLVSKDGFNAVETNSLTK